MSYVQSGFKELNEFEFVMGSKIGLVWMKPNGSIDAFLWVQKPNGSIEAFKKMKSWKWQSSFKNDGKHS